MCASASFPTHGRKRKPQETMNSPMVNTAILIDSNQRRDQNKRDRA
jgi:hypothetical protein